MKPARLFPSVFRLLPLVLLGACGGLTTPPQDVSVGLALTSTGLPPRLEQDGHVLVLSSLQLFGKVFVQGQDVGQEQLAQIAIDAPLTTAWTSLAEGPLARGSYQHLHVELSSIVLVGSWDGARIHLAASQTQSGDFTLSTDWQVKLGQVSAQSLVCDPLHWMTKGVEGQKLQLIDPDSDEAAPELMSRFFSSLTAARDDNHDGVDDAHRP